MNLEPWSSYDGDTAADIAEATSMSALLSSVFGPLPTTSTPPASTPTNAAWIDLNEDYQETTGSVTITYSYWVFDAAAGVNIDVCNTNAVYEQNNADFGPGNDPYFPTSLGSFTSHGIAGCTYSGTHTSVGTMTCPGVNSISCSQAGDYGKQLNCNGVIGLGEFMYDLIICEW
jgi:hypothetical protein